MILYCRSAKWSTRTGRATRNGPASEDARSSVKRLGWSKASSDAGLRSSTPKDYSLVQKQSLNR